MLSLRLPRANAKQAEAASYHELSGHPWAGMRVRMVLSAKDQAGQIGKSEPVEFILPQRRFDNPIARGDRRAAALPGRGSAQPRPSAASRSMRIALEPDGFFPDRHAYLGLRSAYWRLHARQARAPA